MRPAAVWLAESYLMMFSKFSCNTPPGALRYGKLRWPGQFRWTSSAGSEGCFELYYFSKKLQGV